MLEEFEAENNTGGDRDDAPVPIKVRIWYWLLGVLLCALLSGGLYWRTFCNVYGCVSLSDYEWLHHSQSIGLTGWSKWPASPAQQLGTSWHGSMKCTMGFGSDVKAWDARKNGWCYAEDGNKR